MMFTIDPADEQEGFCQETVSEGARAYLSDLAAGGKKDCISIALVHPWNGPALP